MKKAIMLSVLVLSCFSLFAQTSEPPIEIEGNGKVIFEDGRIEEGKVKFNALFQRRVFLMQEGQDQQTLKVKDVKEFFIEDHHYVKLDPVRLGVDEDEVAEMLVDDDSKIKVYELFWQQNIGQDSGNGVFVYTTYREFYVLFPGMDKPKGVDDISFIPFKKKVSKYVEDCPALAEKISNQEDGYKAGLLAKGGQGEGLRDLFLRIAQEYQNCK